MEYPTIKAYLGAPGRSVENGFAKLPEPEQRALLEEAFAVCGVDLVRKGMATFDGPEPFHAGQFFGTCIIGRMGGAPYEFERGYFQAPVEAPVEDIYAYASHVLGLPAEVAEVLSGAHYAAPKVVHDVAVAWLARQAPDGWASVDTATN